MSRKRVLLLGLLALVLLFGLIQLVPYGRDHNNPPVQNEPAWNEPRTRELAVGACFDCHSNETIWPWYSNVAPVSWLVQRDVDEGRSRLNFSEWGRRRQEGHEAAEIVREGEMPPWQYKLMHSSARLPAEEKDALINGLTATLGQP
jgi:mono/diheme cytochrome c family protein